MCVHICVLFIVHVCEHDLETGHVIMDTSAGERAELQSVLTPAVRTHV